MQHTVIQKIHTYTKMGGSGKSSATCFRQITTPAFHRFILCRTVALPDTQPTVSKHSRRPENEHSNYLKLNTVLWHFTEISHWNAPFQEILTEASTSYGGN